MDISRGIFYQLTFEDDIEPDDFLKMLSTKIKEHSERNRPTRSGMFERMAIFASRHNRISAPDDSVQPIVQYLFLVEGSFGKLPWLVGLLEQFGQVTFPLGDSDWSFSADSDIGPFARSPS